MQSRLGFSLFATAIAASAAAHALVMATFSRVHVGTDGSADQSEMTVVFDTPEARQPEPEFEIGQRLAKGYATHAADGSREQVARQAPQDQPSLSLDPVGRSLVVDVPSMPTGAAPARGSLAAPPAAASAESAAIAPRPPLEALVERATGDVMQWAPPDPTEVVMQAMPIRPSAPQQPQRATAGASGGGGTGADPAPKSDSEVDAFSVLGSAEFRDGRVSVRSGRQVKTRRPKIRLAGMIDMVQASATSVVLKVAVDATGKVTDVDVVRSSGSNEIDQPCRVAMYEWWFEPKKDAAGRAVPDVFKFTISFR
jgi:TonB family protein